jgi:hypothetical protein
MHSQLDRAASVQNTCTATSSPCVADFPSSVPTQTAAALRNDPDVPSLATEHVRSTLFASSQNSVGGDGSHKRASSPGLSDFPSSAEPDASDAAWSPPRTTRPAGASLSVVTATALASGAARGAVAGAGASPRGVIAGNSPGAPDNSIAHCAVTALGASNSVRSSATSESMHLPFPEDSAVDCSPQRRWRGPTQQDGTMASVPSPSVRPGVSSEGAGDTADGGLVEVERAAANLNTTTTDKMVALVAAVRQWERWSPRSSTSVAACAGMREGSEIGTVVAVIQQVHPTQTVGARGSTLRTVYIGDPTRQNFEVTVSATLQLFDWLHCSRHLRFSTACQFVITKKRQHQRCPFTLKHMQFVSSSLWHSPPSTSFFLTNHSPITHRDLMTHNTLANHSPRSHDPQHSLTSCSPRSHSPQHTLANHSPRSHDPQHTLANHSPRSHGRTTMPWLLQDLGPHPAQMEPR